MAQISLVVPNDLWHRISRTAQQIFKYGQSCRTFNAARVSAALQQPEAPGVRNV
jgi:hypothetical protein